MKQYDILHKSNWEMPLLENPNPLDNLNEEINF